MVCHLRDFFYPLVAVLRNVYFTFLVEPTVNECSIGDAHVQTPYLGLCRFFVIFCGFMALLGVWGGW